MRHGARGHKRGVALIDTRHLLAVLGEARHHLTRAMAVLPIHAPEYKAASVLTDHIDDLAGLLTGSREHFHLQPHTASGQTK